MNLPTMSRMAGWLSCPMHKRDDRPPGKPAKFGTAVHRIVEDELSGVPSKDTDKAGAVAGRALDWLADHGLRGRPEPAYAIDPSSGEARKLGERIGREYAKHGAKDHEICGSADVVHDLCVVDIKTGSYSPSHEDQIHALGYAVARAHGHKSVRLVLLYANEHEATPLERGMDAMELDAYGAKLREAAQREPAPTPGHHCRTTYCGARKACDAFAAWERS